MFHLLIVIPLFAFLVSRPVSADAPAKPTLREMVDAIVSGEFDNNYFAGSAQSDLDRKLVTISETEDEEKKTVGEDWLIQMCVRDKGVALQDGMEIQNDLQVDIFLF